MKLSRLIIVCTLATSLGCLAQGTYGTKADKAVQNAKTEDKAEAEIPGMTIERSVPGKLLGLQVLGGNFKLSFYDKDKQPVQADMKQAVMRWRVNYQKAEERALLDVGGDGTFLTSAFVVRPPYNFRLFIVLLTGDSEKDKNAETYSVDFRG